MFLPFCLLVCFLQVFLTEPYLVPWEGRYCAIYLQSCKGLENLNPNHTLNCPEANHKCKYLRCLSQRCHETEGCDFDSYWTLKTTLCFIFLKVCGPLACLSRQRYSKIYANKTGGWSKFCVRVQVKHGMKLLSTPL